MGIGERAAMARKHFTTAERGDETIWVVADDAPQWVTDLAYAAHGDFMPDDYRYAFIVSALDMVAEAGEDAGEDVGDYSDDLDAATDIYNADRYRWLASNLNRAGYVDEITEELGHSDYGIAGDIGMGQYREREETLGQVLASLAELEDDDDDAEADERGVVEVFDRELYASRHSSASIAECGNCGRMWDDAVITGVTPAPAGRCPFEAEHDDDTADHVHRFGELERSPIAGTVHRKCQVPGCRAVSALDDDDETGGPTDD